MKYVMLIVLFIGVAVAQTKEQRYQIEKLGTLDGFDLTILVDGETGKTWQLVSDSVVIEKGSKVALQKFYIWKQVLFNPNVSIVTPRYTVSPDSTIAKK